MSHNKANILHLVVLGSLGLTTAAQAEEPVKLDEYVTESEKEDVFSVIPSEPSETMYGFDKSILETPRSISEVSSELVMNYGLRSVDDLVRLTPGAFTSSFFGIQGAMDIRGEPADNYFRGFQRIANPGAFKTNIRGAGKLEISRGPVSPLYGTGSVGGQLNYIPKTAKTDTAKYLESPTGRIDLTLGTYDQKILAAEGGMPFTLAGKQGGIYVFGEVEDSGSYFEKYEPSGNIFQVAVNMDVTDNTTIEFGAQYQHDERIQVPGWTRVTQELVDNGTYITGTPPALNTDNPIGIDRLLPQESGIAPVPGAPNASISKVGSFCLPISVDFTTQYTYNGMDVYCFNANPFPGLTNTGTTKLDHDQTFIDDLDYANSDVLTAYLDVVTYLENDKVWKNQFFYDYLDHEKYQSWGFTADYPSTKAMEFRSTLQFPAKLSDNVLTDNIVGVNYRKYTADLNHAFFDETFDFRDLSVGPTPDDRIDWAVEDFVLPDGTLRRNFNLEEVSESTNAGLFFLTDMSMDKFKVLAGARYDNFDVESYDEAYKLDETLQIDADGDGLPDKKSGSKDATSFNLSLSYVTDEGFVPYVTYAESASLSTNQVGGISPGAIDNGQFLQDAKLSEVGIKYENPAKTIFAGLSYFDQEKSFRDSQNNNLIAVYSKGLELELRALLTDSLSITGTATHIETTEVGNSFFVVNQADFAAQNGLNVEDLYGGRVAGNRDTFTGAGVELERGGLPDNVLSLYGNYLKPMGKGKLTSSLGFTWVDETYNDWAESVLLPSYMVWTGSVGYIGKRYDVLLAVNNLLDEEYFTSADLFEAVVVKPSEGRTASLTMSYKF
ncbi:MAG: TonB-dependent siderophore receptor [Thiotrichales bacterium]